MGSKLKPKTIFLGIIQRVVEKRRRMVGIRLLLKRILNSKWGSIYVKRESGDFDLWTEKWTGFTGLGKSS